LEAEPPVPARVATRATVTDVGTDPVRVFEVRSRLTLRLTVWSGVRRQEQHKINSSLGSMAYALTQMLPVAVLARISHTGSGEKPLHLA
jgi:hypothetical protein